MDNTAPGDFNEALVAIGQPPVHFAGRLLEQFHRVRKHKLASTGAVIAFVLVVVAIFAPFLAPYDPLKQDLYGTLQPPSWSHWLGTDDLGRDTLSRIIFGARVSVEVGFISVGIGMVAGIPLGLAAGYFGGWIDNMLSRVIDALLAFPALVLALGITAVLGANLTNVMIAVGIIFVPLFGRLVRGATLTLRERQFVEAARAMGASHLWIIVYHIFPNLISVVVVQATLSIGFAIMAEAGLSFLGLGLAPPGASWGTMLRSAYGYMQSDPWLPISPGLALVFAVAGFNAMGDGLRDLLDPRLKHVLA